MPVQLLDSRLSLHNIYNSGTRIVTATAAFIGDIGLQTLAVVGTPNQENVRVQLSGTIGVSADAPSIVYIYVVRGITGTIRFGTIVFNSRVDLSAGTTLLSFTAGDFPAANIVTAGQIRYTMHISSTLENPVTLVGPVSFNGSAYAGSS